jgi:hypothetical protein
MIVSVFKNLMRIVPQPLKKSGFSQAAFLQMTPETAILSIAFFFILSLFEIKADEVLTRTREVLSGKITLKTGRILLKQDNNAEREIEPDKFLDITFSGIKPAIASTKVIFPLTEKRGGGLPPGWKNQDVGYSRNRGFATWQQEGNNNPSGVFTVRSAGTGLTPVSDSFHFAFTTIENDGIAVVRVSGKGGLDKKGCAGLMIRKNTDVKSQFVSIGVSQQGVPVLELREQNGSATSSVIFTNRGEFSWVKLIWTKSNVIAGFSADGIKWENAEPISINLSYPANIGFFVYSGNEKYMAQLRFQEASIISFEKPAISSENPIAGNYLPAQVVLRNGSILSGYMNRMKDGFLQFRFLDNNLSISTNDIGSIRFFPMPYEWQNEAVRSGSGLFLVNGKFVEAAISGIENGIVKTMVQDKTADFRIPYDLAAVQFLPANYGANAYEIRLVNGSVVFADYVRFMDDSILVGSKTSAELKIAKSELAGVRRIGNLEATFSISLSAQKSGAITAELETTTGEKINGIIKLIENEPIIESQDGKRIKLKQDTIKNLFINNVVSVATESAGIADKIRQFSAIDFYQKTMRGRSYMQNDVLYLEDYAAIRNFQSPEPTYFLCCPVEGDFEILAEVVSPESLPRGSYAGLLIQDSVNTTANGIFCGTDSRQMLFVRRYDDRLGSHSRLDFRSPLKLKVERTRRRLTVSASSSKSGSSWNFVNSYELDLPSVLYAGFAIVNTNKDLKPVVAGFKNIEIKKKQDSEAPVKIILVNGAALNCEILNGNETSLTISSILSPKMSVPLNCIAYICFDGSLAQPSIQKSDRRGILLKNDDFFECEFKEIDGNTITVSSTVFGIRYFRIGDDVKRIYLNPLSESKYGYEVVLQDSSRIIVKNMNIREANFILTDDLSESVYELPISLIREIKKK